MTVGELKEKLEDYGDDVEVGVIRHGMTNYYKYALTGDVSDYILAGEGVYFVIERIDEERE